jgi:hypothetical protein
MATPLRQGAACEAMPPIPVSPQPHSLEPRPVPKMARKTGERCTDGWISDRKMMERTPWTPGIPSHDRHAWTKSCRISIPDRGTASMSFWKSVLSSGNGAHEPCGHALLVAEWRPRVPSFFSPVVRRQIKASGTRHLVDEDENPCPACRTSSSMAFWTSSWSAPAWSEAFRAAGWPWSRSRPPAFAGVTFMFRSCPGLSRRYKPGQCSESSPKGMSDFSARLSPPGRPWS